jgi:hypothetical protein
MPEMLQYCGQELTVGAIADKTCDTINETGTTRRMDKTVHLAGIRCDGSAHGGCQAGCLLFWREEWLTPVDGADPPGRAEPAQPGANVDAALAALEAATQRVDPAGETVYRCQATDLLRASRPLRWTEMGQYVRDVRNGNGTLWSVVRGFLIDRFNRYQGISTRHLPRWLRISHGRTFPFIRTKGPNTRTPAMGLQVGDRVEVRARAEIMATLGPNYKTRGLLFDAEMLPYCGKEARVERSVERIIDDKTGKMIKLRDCYVLEGVVCTAIYHRSCPRAITPYWREAWLRRVPEPVDSSVE